MKVYTVKDLADMFQVSQPVIYKWEASGLLKSIPKMRPMRFTRSAVLSAMDVKADIDVWKLKRENRKLTSEVNRLKSFIRGLAVKAAEELGGEE